MVEREVEDEASQRQERAEVACAMAGDRAAFSRLVRTHHAMVYRLCRRYLAGSAPADAEDLTQDTFVRAFVERERFDGARPVAPWLATIARRACIDRLRRRAPEPASHDAALAAADGTSSPEARAAARQALDRAGQALADLPEGPREALVLYTQENLSYAEVAEALEVPMGTVMTWLHRARRKLQAAAEAPPALPRPREVSP